GLTKLGAGMLTLTAPNMLAGPTTVSGGTLQLTPNVASVGIKFATNRSGSSTYAVIGIAGAVRMGNWNNLTGINQPTPQTLYDNSNVANGATVTWNNPGGDCYDVFVASQTDQNAQLLNSYLDNHPDGTETVSVSGVPYRNYEVFVYLASDTNGRKGQVSIGNTTYYYATDAKNTAVPYPLNQTTDTSQNYPAANYAVFAGLTGPSFTVSQMALANNGIAAVEIVGQSMANPLPTTTALAVAGGATVDLNGASQRVASLTDVVSGVGGTITNSNTTFPATLTLGTTGGATFSGSIQDGNSPISVVFSGTGRQVLAGVDTYRGGTTVTSGTLILASDTAIADGTSLIVGAGGTLIFDPSQATASPVLSSTEESPIAVVTAVPEPGTWALFAAALGSAVACYRFRRIRVWVRQHRQE
ncbi:MAG: autotransporter-associated beta strand repeat-containing protein, partial [Thermoguttaceae bacterium]